VSVGDEEGVSSVCGTKNVGVGDEAGVGEEEVFLRSVPLLI